MQSIMDNKLKDELRLQIELTSNCNSTCQGCSRFVSKSDIVNPNIKIGNKGNMTEDMWKSIFDDQRITDKLNTLSLTGAYGDFMLHPKALEFIDYALKKSKNIKNFFIETNGGLHNTSWWKKLAKYDVKVRFAFDGIDDETHQRYRRGVNFNKVLENAKAFKEAGGHTTWAMIEFQHNIHQIEQAKKIASELGFKFTLKNNRIIQHTNYKGEVKNEYKDRKPLIRKKNLNNQGVEYDKSNKEEILSYANKLKFNSQREYDNFSDVTCRWGLQNKFNIDYDGRITRCCFFSSMYHRQPDFKDYNKGPNFYRSKMKMERENGYNWYLKKYGFEFNSLKKNNIYDILTHEFFTDALPDSLKNTTFSKNNPRVLTCPKFCGEIQTEYKVTRGLQVNE